MIARFLTDEELGPEIRKLMTGKNLCCAVAFWGTGAAKALFHSAQVPDDARLICDISMGGTNPRELEALGAPKNPNLVHLHGLHAKVYLSDIGLITASANASNNGIGFLEVARLVEAGTFHEAGSDAYRCALKWFNSLWKRSSAIDGDALVAAEDAWRRRKAGATGSSHAADPKSLLDQVMAKPEAFRGVGFVFSSSTSTKKHREEAAAALIENDDALAEPLLSESERRALSSWPLGNLFSDWSAEDLSAWPQRFLCVHQGKGGGTSYWFYERSYPILVDPDRGGVLATQRPVLRSALGFRHARKTMANTDGMRLRAIFEAIGEEGYRLFESGEKLASFLADIEQPR